ncbi:MAG: class I mannose-6-phosphate isomerase [Alistipes sp.]|nr:class I mannose-6-phosphate isomerase [Alistipes sp.]
MYPIKFKPQLKENLWGGQRLLDIKKGLYPRTTDKTKSYGESWDISGVKGSISKVANGFLKGNNLQEIIEVYMGELVGEEVFERFGLDFPLLIKNLDCNDTLSVQVHPNDELAAERHNSFGKTEMWYIADAEEGAVIYLGFKDKNITREEYIRAVAEGTVADILEAVPVKKGDVFFIPAGTVHALAKGLNVVEIQQTSDITYRIFDWNRVDSEGKSRELHTALAVDAIDFESGVGECRRTYAAAPNSEVNIVDCDYFKTDMLVVEGSVELDYCQRDSFTIYICIEGEVKVSLDNETSETLRTGEVMLVPAIANEVLVEGKAQILATHL